MELTQLRILEGDGTGTEISRVILTISLLNHPHWQSQINPPGAPGQEKKVWVPSDLLFLLNLFLICVVLLPLPLKRKYDCSIYSFGQRYKRDWFTLFKIQCVFRECKAQWWRRSLHCFKITIKTHFYSWRYRAWLYAQLQTTHVIWVFKLQAIM